MEDGHYCPVPLCLLPCPPSPLLPRPPLPSAPSPSPFCPVPLSLLPCSPLHSALSHTKQGALKPVFASLASSALCVQGNLRERFGIPANQAHRALDDSQVMQDVVSHMLKLNGTLTISDVIARKSKCSGTLGDLFGPGTHVLLETGNMMIALTRLLKHGHQARIYCNARFAAMLLLSLDGYSFVVRQLQPMECCYMKGSKPKRKQCVYVANFFVNLLEAILGVGAKAALSRCPCFGLSRIRHCIITIVV